MLQIQSSGHLFQHKDSHADNNMTQIQDHLKALVDQSRLQLQETDQSKIAGGKALSINLKPKSKDQKREWSKEIFRVATASSNSSTKKLNKSDNGSTLSQPRKQFNLHETFNNSSRVDNMLNFKKGSQTRLFNQRFAKKVSANITRNF